MKTKEIEHLRNLLCSEGELPAPSQMELLKLFEEAMLSTTRTNLKDRANWSGQLNSVSVKP